MTIRYKSETSDLTTTNVTPVLTCPIDATIIVKSIQAVHDTASNVDTHALVTKSGGSPKIGSFIVLIAFVVPIKS